jgi:predicted nucleotidyltransferase
MRVHERQVLDRIAANLRERFAERITALYAFGSRVRGRHGAWSDFDVLVVIRDKDPRAEAEIVSMIVDEEFKAGLSFTPVVKDAQAFDLEKGFQTPFYENITREGVLL